MRTFHLTLLSAFTLLLSCTPTRFVEPLDKKEIAVGLSYGGPALDGPVPIPLPLTSVEVGYGLDTGLTGFVALHTTAILFGNLQVDGGITYQVLDQKGYRPNISVSPAFNLITNFEGSTKFWPILDLNGYWNYGQRQNYLYLGVNNYFELSPTLALDQPQIQPWLFNPQIGHVVKGQKHPWQLTTELKYLGPNLDNSYAFIPYAPAFGSRGALSVMVGYRWTFQTS